MILRSDLAFLQTMFDLKRDISVNRRARAILRSDLALLQTMFDLKRDISVNRQDRAILRSDLALLQSCSHTLYRVPRPV